MHVAPERRRKKKNLQHKLTPPAAPPSKNKKQQINMFSFLRGGGCFSRLGSIAMNNSPIFDSIMRRGFATKRHKRVIKMAKGYR